MATYYVRTKEDHEVHTSTCAWLPNPENRKYLGVFSDCKEAVKEAKKTYATANGCYHCSNECHTG